MLSTAIPEFLQRIQSIEGLSSLSEAFNTSVDVYTMELAFCESQV